VAVESWPAERRRPDDRNFVHYVALGKGRGFHRLHKRFTASSLVVVVIFLGCYGSYVAMSAFARNVMERRLAGNINVGLVLGLLQFASTVLIAWVRGRYSKTALDPLAERLRTEIEGPRRPSLPRGRR
jgi:uncharacterized membrane protein (DUF485 family)